LVFLTGAETGWSFFRACSTVDQKVARGQIPVNDAQLKVEVGQERANLLRDLQQGKLLPFRPTFVIQLPSHQNVIKVRAQRREGKEFDVQDGSFDGENGRDANQLRMLPALLKYPGLCSTPLRSETSV
jgi:uncharacterized protein (DUF1499 family)